MDQTLPPGRLTRAAPLAAFALGALCALLIVVLPPWRLEAIVSASGLDQVFAAARPPLGGTARAALALASGGAVAALAWAVLALAPRLLPMRAAAAEHSDVPVLRRADAHPDAPSRRPLRVSEDLGVPRPIGAVGAEPVNPEPIVQRTLPADLDTPLAAIDPEAIPATPREPVRPVAPLARAAPVEHGPAVDEAIETFELTPIRRTPKPAAAPTPARPTSLAAMLDRLEQGAARRGTKPAPSLEETLGMLRGLATRGGAAAESHTRVSLSS